MRSRAFVCALLAAAVIPAYSPVFHNSFVGYDDSEYVTENVHVNTGMNWENTAWAFTAAHSSNWHPLTWLSHALDWSLFGGWAGGHHLTSLLLHVANTILLFLWLSGATGSMGRSAFVALVFGLHPVHVESAAWVAERKDVLSTLFGLLALLAYGAYAKRPAIGRYLLVAGLFACGLLAKQMLVTLPVLLVLLDWWPLGRLSPVVRWPRLLIEKLPLLALSALAGAAALWAQRAGGSISGAARLPIALRFSNAAVSYWRYIGKTFWPVHLSAFYPFPGHGIALWSVAASMLALAAVSWAVVAYRKRHPWLVVGWFWYVLTLLPVIGVVQVGMQSMADRYLYVPMVGLAIALTWEIASRAKGPVLPVAAGVALTACAILTWRQVHVWQDGVTLFTHAIEVTQDNFVAHDNLGVELDRRGEYEAALAEYRETLRIKPGDIHGETNYAQANFAKGERLFNGGKPDEALAAFHEGLQYRPGNALAHTFAGLILTEKHQLAPAIREFHEALAIDPALARAQMGLGVALSWSGRALEAEPAFEAAARFDPSNAEARYDLGLVLASLGRNDEALGAYQAALQLKPGFGAVLASQAEVLYALGRYEEAWRAALAAKAGNAEVDPPVFAKLAARFQK
jgi:Flp pilus assembly protein TadD